MNKAIFAGIDAGGTEFKCIVGTGPKDILAFERIPVTTPEETLPRCVLFFKRAALEFGQFIKLGIASFGPISLHKASPDYGCITSTPKLVWANTNIVAYFEQALSVPVVFDTDVNGALLGEQKWGAAKSLDNVVYVTVGTGVGAGVMMEARLLYGSIHVEAGHMLIPQRADDSFRGCCPFHGPCLEGLISGPALAERWQQDPQTIEEGHVAWELQAHYLAAMCVNLSLVYSPQRIILGGGVMQQAQLVALTQQCYLSQMNNYLGDQNKSVQTFIVGAALGGLAGALGSLVLAQRDY